MAKNFDIDKLVFDGNTIHYRNVYVDELGTIIRVGIDEECEKYIVEGSSIDDMFGCYVPKDVFNEYDDNELEVYVKENYYD